MPSLFNAHIELRRLLLGKEPVPFTPINVFGLPLVDTPTPKVQVDANR